MLLFMNTFFIWKLSASKRHKQSSQGDNGMEASVPALRELLEMVRSLQHLIEATGLYPSEFLDMSNRTHSR